MVELKIIQNGARPDIYHTLKDAIQFLDLKPGSTIAESEIAKQLGVSRTPIREVLIRLSNENLIDIYPQRGTYVSKIDFFLAQETAYMRHILDSRICLDLCAQKVDVRKETSDTLYFMENAVRDKDVLKYIRLDNSFHKAIFRLAGHAAVWDIISNTRAHYNRVCFLDLMLPGHLEKSYEDHSNIADYIQIGDFQSLSRLLETHNDYNGVDHDKIHDSFPEYFPD